MEGPQRTGVHDRADSGVGNSGDHPACVMAHGAMQPLASAPLAAPLPRRSEAEPFRNSRSHGRATVVLWSVSAFLLQTPGGNPAAPANIRSGHATPTGLSSNH